jgi:hypothetical protein
LQRYSQRLPERLGVSRIKRQLDQKFGGGRANNDV